MVMTDMMSSWEERGAFVSFEHGAFGHAFEWRTRRSLRSPMRRTLCRRCDDSVPRRRPQLIRGMGYGCETIYRVVYDVI